MDRQLNLNFNCNFHLKVLTYFESYLCTHDMRDGVKPLLTIVNNFYRSLSTLPALSGNGHLTMALFGASFLQCLTSWRGFPKHLQTDLDMEYLPTRGTIKITILLPMWDSYMYICICISLKRKSTNGLMT